MVLPIVVFLHFFPSVSWYCLFLLFTELCIPLNKCIIIINNYDACESMSSSGYPTSLWSGRCFKAWGLLGLLSFHIKKVGNDIRYVFQIRQSFKTSPGSTLTLQLHMHEWRAITTIIETARSALKWLWIQDYMNKSRINPGNRNSVTPCYITDDVSEQRSKWFIEKIAHVIERESFPHMKYNSLSISFVSCW